jgi:K+-transporting ATPase KdpF subunit
MHGRFLISSGFHRFHPGDAWSYLGIGAGMSFSQIILFVVAVVMFLYLGYAMFKPEKF